MKNTLQQIVSTADSLTSQHQKTRDEWNKISVDHRNRREHLNSQKREVFDEIERQRNVRDKENANVRKAKKLREFVKDKFHAKRDEVNPNRQWGGRSRREESLPELKEKIRRLEMDHQIGKLKEKEFNERADKLRRRVRELEEGASNSSSDSDHPELAKLEAAFEEAHRRVLDAADSAQAAHDLMGKLQDETRRLSDEHERAHVAFMRARDESDKEHRRYIVAMRLAFSGKNLIRAIKERSDGVQPAKAAATAESVDLMSALLSGQALSTEQLMAMQRRD